MDDVAEIAALRALATKGLTSGKRSDKPTPLGLAVRNYLKEQNNDVA